MRERPVLMLSLLFLLGILYGEKGWILFPVLGIILLWYSEPWKEQGLRKLCFSVGLLLAFGVGWLHMEREISLRECSLSKVAEGQEVLLSGKLKRVEEKTRCNYYYLTDCHIRLSDQTMPCNDVLAYVSSDEGSIGQILVLQGTITLFDQTANEGGFDARSFYRSQKIDFGLWVTKVCSVNGRPDVLLCKLQNLRKQLRGVIEASVSDEGVLSAMLLGDKSGLNQEIKSLYQSAGIAHILAISGLHMSLLGLGLYRLLKKRLGLGYPLSVLWTTLFLLNYSLMTGSGISTLRAVLMMLVFLLAELLGLGYDLLSGLGLAVIVLLWNNPFLIGYTGFQFSVAAVLGIGVGGKVFTGFWIHCLGGGTEMAEDTDESPRVREEAQGRLAAGGRRLTAWLQNKWDSQKEGLWISLAIQLFTLPLVACNYYELPVYAMVLNLFVLAGAGGLLLLAVAGAVLGLIFPVLGKILLAPCGLLLGIYRNLCEIFLALPGARYICGKPAGWQILLYYVLLAVLLFLLWCRTRKERLHPEEGGEKKRGRNENRSDRDNWNEKRKDRGERGNNRIKNWRSWSLPGKKIVTRMKLAILLSILFLVLLFPEKKSFEIDVLDVGQGDGIYLCTSDGISMFVDGGSTSEKKVGEYRILPFLKSKGVKEISYWFVSHTDNDHISGLTEVLESGYRVRNLVLAKAQSENEKAGKLEALAQAYGTDVIYLKAGDRLSTSKASMECLYPEAGQEAEDVNDLCLTLQFKDDGFKAFFAGDISTEVEEKLVDQRGLEKVDLYKASHHGSDYSNGDDLLQVLEPEITVASAGEDNRYGHPGQQAIERIKASGSRFYCTIGCGQVKIKAKKDGKIHVFTKKQICNS